MNSQEVKGVKILVCLFVYNASKTIESVLEALFKQSYKDFAIFLIDNNSGDGTMSIADNYLKAVTFGGVPLPDLFNFKGETTKSTLLDQLERLVEILKNRVNLPDLRFIRFVGQKEILDEGNMQNWINSMKDSLSKLC